MIKEVDYEWDSEKKDSEKMEQNPTWNEEDERIKDNCIEYIKASCLDHKEFIECIDWLESLKKRVKGE